MLDENLTVIAEKKITDSKDIALLESSFNGTELSFKFYDSIKKLMKYKLDDLSGKLANEVSIPLSNIESFFLKAVNCY